MRCFNQGIGGCYLGLLAVIDSITLFLHCACTDCRMYARCATLKIDRFRPHSALEKTVDFSLQYP
jgi:hypothetical protein